MNFAQPNNRKSLVVLAAIMTLFAQSVSFVKAAPVVKLPPKAGAQFNIEIAKRFPMMLAESKSELVVKKDSGEFHNQYTVWGISWHDTSAINCKFGLRTKETGATKAVCQVSTVRFDNNTKHWKEPAGLVYSNPVPLPKGSTWSESYIDFAKFAPKAPAKKPTTISVKSAVDKAALAKATVLMMPQSDGKYKSKAIGLQNKLGLSGLKKTDALGLIKESHEPFTPSEYVYYVRVVLLNNSNQCVGLPTNTVQVTYGEPEPPVTMYDTTNKNLPPVAHPAARILKYEPVQPRVNGASYRFECTRDMPLIGYKKGQKLDFTPHAEDKSWWEELGDFISDVTSFIADATNWVSKAYNSIKEFAVNAVAGVVGDWAKGPLMMALNTGLMAMGIPPSLPNFSELSTMGRDYMIQCAADYAGVSGDDAVTVVNAFSSMATKQENGGGNAAIWLKPDPDAYYRPAYVIVEVTNPSPDQVTDRVKLYLSLDPVGDPDFKLYQEPVFNAPSADIPHLAPGQTVQVPVFLTEYTQYRMSDNDIQAGQHRFMIRYANFPLKITASTSFGNMNTKNPWVTQQALTLQSCKNVYNASPK